MQKLVGQPHDGKCIVCGKKSGIAVICKRCCAVAEEREKKKLAKKKKPCPTCGSPQPEIRYLRFKIPRKGQVFYISPDFRARECTDDYHFHFDRSSTATMFRQEP
jgi:hypothetical protein